MSTLFLTFFKLIFNADFCNISKDAKEKLAYQLAEMKGTIDTMLNAIKEDCNG